MLSVSDRSDESLLLLYEGIRTEVEADRRSMRSGQILRFTGNAAITAYAATIAEEMARRRLNFIPIEWPPGQE